MKVLRATLQDMDSLCHVFANDGKEHKRGLHEYPLMNMLMDENNVFLIARDPQPLGFVFMRIKGEEAKIDLFSTISSAQPSVGKKLLDEASKYASNIVAYVPKSDEVALNAFLKNGFQLRDEVPHLFGEGVHGALLVRKTRASAKSVKKKRAVRKHKKKARTPAQQEQSGTGVLVSPVLVQNLKKLEDIG